MDSITQLTLGAAVGEATAGKEVGSSAPLWGAAIGTLPDLDILADPFLSEAQALLFHRSLTHSLLFAAVVAPLLGAGLSRLHPDASPARWGILTGVVLLTHIGLDCLTSYGTQIFWPFSSSPVIGSTVFVIDPLYTLPLAAGLLTALRWRPAARPRRWANYAGLALSSAYLLLTVAHKGHVNRVFANALQAQSLPAERVFTRPTPFNNVLWTAIAEAEDGFYVGYYSLLDDGVPTTFRYVPKQHDLLEEDAEAPAVQHLRRFSRGYFAVRQAPDGRRKLVDLRFGRSDVGLTEDGSYLFAFWLQEDEAGQVTGLRRDTPELRLSSELFHRFVAHICGQQIAN